MNSRQNIFIFSLIIILLTPGWSVFASEKSPGNLYALSAVLMDGDSGRVLYQKSGNTPRPNASTTKVMTCILALENGKGDDYVKVSANAVSQPEVRLGLSIGEQYYLEDLLYSLMLQSHNDSAVAIAECIGGSVDNFSAMMNAKAKEIGCKNTHFVTPNGLDAENSGGTHHTTAEDLALIMRYAIHNDVFLKITQTEEYSFSDLSKKRHFSVHNTNALLHMTDGVLAGKTGYTGDAGYCYVRAPFDGTISKSTVDIGSYVGGDITAGAFVTMLWNQEPFSLFIDLGTNGEIVFGNSDFMFSCACSAGPAFEGGDISCGMRATDGAIEACTIDAETMEPKLTIVGNEGTKPVGICGSGIIDIISELFRCKIINPKGKFVREGRRVKRDADGMGSYVLAFEGEEAGSSKDVEITEVDIDSFIRAKGAIFSAIRTMLSYCDFDISMIENVYVAGGIGSGINMANAINIGMFPDIPVEMYHYVGNTSLAGAYAMLCSTESERKVYDLAANMTYIELSTIPQYMDEFVGACFLPHTDASLFPNR